jgi:hypothetical protein
MPDEYSKGMHASQTQKTLERKRMDAKMSVDGYIDKNAIDSRAFINYMA